MSSLEMLTLLELAHGRPTSLERAEAQPSPLLNFVASGGPLAGYLRASIAAADGAVVGYGRPLRGWG